MDKCVRSWAYMKTWNFCSVNERCWDAWENRKCVGGKPNTEEAMSRKKRIMEPAEH